MSKDSTMDITRADALAEAAYHLRSASDAELEQVLYSLVGDRKCYNFKIVADYSSDWPVKYTPGSL